MCVVSGTFNDFFIFAGRVTYGLIHINDWLPTIFRLAGGNPDHVVESDGVDVWDSINADEFSPR